MTVVYVVVETVVMLVVRVTTEVVQLHCERPVTALCTVLSSFGGSGPRFGGGSGFGGGSCFGGFSLL